MSTAAPQFTRFDFDPPDPPNDGIRFVDHAPTGRSGHLGHALVEYAPGQILAFYPNCSEAPGLNTHGPEWAGHNGDGWMEYKRSEDGGYTWSAPFALPYSKRVYDEGRGRSVMCEKAVCTPESGIVLFNMECDISTNLDWGPGRVPTFLRSADGGRSWTEPEAVCGMRGRIFDAIVNEDAILALQRASVYVLHASTDGGKTFARRGELPFDGGNRCYGTLCALHDGHLLAYVYNREDEQHLDYAISGDGGQTWSSPRKTCFEKKIRNPQMAAFGNGFVLHGRSGGGGLTGGHLVLYASPDGIHWDAGRYLRMQEAGAGAYSNNLLVHDSESGSVKHLLIQASHAYEKSKTSIYHWRLRTRS